MGRVALIAIKKMIVVMVACCIAAVPCIGFASDLPVTTGAAVIAGDAVWVGATDCIARIDTNDGSCQLFGVYGDVIATGVYDIAVTQSGAVWFLANSGVCRFKGIEWFEYYFYIYFTEIHDIESDYSGRLWAANDAGIWFNENLVWTCLDSIGDVSAAKVREVAVGKSSSVWFASDDHVFLLNGEDWQCFSVPDSLDATDLSGMIVDDSDVLWFTGRNTVYRCEHGAWDVFELWEWGDDSPIITDIGCDNAGVWVTAAGIAGGTVMRYDGESWTTHQFPDCNVTAMCVDQHGDAWFASYGELVRYDGSEWSFYKPENFYHEHYTNVLSDGASIWLVYRNGVVRYTIATGHWTDYPLIVVTGVADKENSERGPVLFPNSPNPFNTDTSISFLLTDNSPVTLDIYNIAGQKVRSYSWETPSTGAVHTLTWDGRNDDGSQVSSGVYFTVLRQHGASAYGNMLFLK